MKKGVVLLFLVVFAVTIVSAESCDLTVSLLNQNPYPAVPGDYVKLVFQVSGLASSECGAINFELLEGYPIQFNPGTDGKITFSGIDYIRNFQSTFQIPYEVRIDADALDGANPIEISVQNKNDAPLLKTFNVEVDDVRADFEVYVKDYDFKTRELTLEVLNIKESDVEALTISIPQQTNIIVKGANRIVVGDLDSNEYTTADFEATMRDGDLTIELTYSDTINVRRSVIKTISFDSTYFTERIADQKTTSKWTYIFGIVAVILIGWWIIRKFTKKKKRH
ncbi:MAG: hypothetical protein KKF50_04265 [Nanoarchaeota archaeon]|nr:hypothetical protein [Nanoarchaeota archaeon]